MSQTFSRGIDLARVVACFMVVVLHVAAMDFHTFGRDWWASNSYDSFTRACVPIFLMITGVLLLGRREPLGLFYRKRVVRIVPPLVFWSAFYLLWYKAQGEVYGGVVASLLVVLRGPVAYHLWYLYALAGIYLFLPFLRHIWQGASPAEQGLYLVAWVVVSAWPMTQTLLGTDFDFLDTYELAPFFGLAGYLFLGAWAHHHCSVHQDAGWYGWLNLAAFVLASLATAWATWLYSAQQGAPDPLFYDYLSPFVVLAALSAFNLLYGLGVRLARSDRVPAGFWRVLKHLASSSLGIYCFHIFVLDGLGRYADVVFAWGSGWLTIPLAAVVIFLISWLTVGLARQSAALRHVM